MSNFTGPLTTNYEVEVTLSGPTYTTSGSYKRSDFMSDLRKVTRQKGEKELDPRE